MIDIITLTEALAQSLKEAFGPRLLFLGYQGSYARGEAVPESDADIVAVLDELALADLDVYRGAVRGAFAGTGVEACGFICGQGELEGWPRYDLLSLALDTRPVLGSLEPYLPEFTDADRREALRNGAASLYHAACHAYLYGDRPGELSGLMKAAFFCQRLFVLCREGRYCATKAGLREALAGRGRLPLSEEDCGQEEAYARLISWSSEVLRQP